MKLLIVLIVFSSSVAKPDTVSDESLQKEIREIQADNLKRFGKRFYDDPESKLAIDKPVQNREVQTLGRSENK